MAKLTVSVGKKVPNPKVQYSMSEAHATLEIETADTEKSKSPEALRQMYAKLFKLVEAAVDAQVQQMGKEFWADQRPATP